MRAEILGTIKRSCGGCGRFEMCEIIRREDAVTELLCRNCKAGSRLAFEASKSETFLKSKSPKKWLVSDAEQAKVANAMIENGGSFAAALGNALLVADKVNAAKIRKAWPEEWAKYAEEK